MHKGDYGIITECLQFESHKPTDRLSYMHPWLVVFAHSDYAKNSFLNDVMMAYIHANQYSQDLFIFFLTALNHHRLSVRIDDLLPTGPGFFLIKVSQDVVTVDHIREWETFFSSSSSEVRLLTYILSTGNTLNNVTCCTLYYTTRQTKSQL